MPTASEWMAFGERTARHRTSACILDTHTVAESDCLIPRKQTQNIMLTVAAPLAAAYVPLGGTHLLQLPAMHAAPKFPKVFMEESAEEEEDLVPSDVVSEVEAVSEAEPVDEAEPIEDSDDLMPSDVVLDEQNVSTPEDTTPTAPEDDAETAAQRTRLITDLLALAAGCNRGETASAADLETARAIAVDLEALGSPCADPTLASECYGTWELVFSDTQLFRSSPFFMAGRAVCEDGAQAAQYDWFCDMHRAALAISTIGKVRQIVSQDRIVSEFEVSAGAVPFLSDALPVFKYSGGLPFTINGAIVSTASVESNMGSSWRLLMDTVEIKGSNIPLLRQALDAGLKLTTRDLGSVLESAVPNYANPRPLFTVSYLDGMVRISRDQDGKLFVYRKQSDSTVPTDYSDVASDLGVGGLLEGLGKVFAS